VPEHVRRKASYLFTAAALNNLEDVGHQVISGLGRFTMPPDVITKYGFIEVQEVQSLLEGLNQRFVCVLCELYHMCWVLKLIVMMSVWTSSMRLKLRSFRKSKKRACNCK
jgi:hypothetical protein